MTYGKRPPLDEQKSLWEATLAAEGITTGAGTAAGDNFIDAALIGAGDNSFVSMLAILYPGDPLLVDSKDITGFDTANGRVTLAGAYKGVVLAIPAGVPYKIVTFRFVPAEVAALVALVNAIEAKLDDGTTGLANIKLLIDAIEGKLDVPANFMADLTTLETRLPAVLSALRIGYLDQLNFDLQEAIALQATLAKQNRILCSMDFWSNPIEEISLTQAAADLPAVLAAWDVTIENLPVGAAIVRAVAMLKFRMVENINAAVNSLDGVTVAGVSQVIQVETDTPGTWRDAINFVDDQFSLAATTREGGDVCIGTINIAVEVTGNDTYHVRWLLSKANQDNLNFNDVQMGIRVLYSL